jgi:hypothetical protein
MKSYQLAIHRCVLCCPVLTPLLPIPVWEPKRSLLSRDSLRTGYFVRVTGRMIQSYIRWLVKRKILTQAI